MPVPVTDAVLVLTASVSPPAQFFADYIVENQATGVAITYWNARLGPQPTIAQLQAVTPAQVAAVKKQLKVSGALALLGDVGAIGTAMRAIYLAAGLTAAQVDAQVPAAVI